MVRSQGTGWGLRGRRFAVIAAISLLLTALCLQVVHFFTICVYQSIPAYLRHDRPVASLPAVFLGSAGATLAVIALILPKISRENDKELFSAGFRAVKYAIALIVIAMLAVGLDWVSSEVLGRESFYINTEEALRADGGRSRYSRRQPITP